ncbi:MAG TPA: outer membrane lipoprotein carrier protein LolA [Terriglobia bacterium]|nr:outer membrane lipoprotein carrier protein LolA [Terriglobia bacterium]
MIGMWAAKRAGGSGQRPARLHTALSIFMSAMMLVAAAQVRPASSAQAGQETDSAKEFVKRLESSYRQVNALRADFTQTYVADERTRVESGTVTFARGGRMRWDYRQPEEKVFVSDGKYLCLYVPAEKQMTRSKVKESDDVRVPFRLLLSRLNLRRVFRQIEFANQALQPEQGDRVLRALPKHEEQGGYHEVLMEITPSFDIRRLVIHFSDQSSMDFSFKGIERNVPLGPSLFSLDPPPGTEVIDQPEDN